MRLNDVWLNVNKEIGFYTKETFEKIPDVPGVYAWFYPLRILTKDPYEFIREVNLILNYDSSVNGKPSKKELIEFKWKTIGLSLDIDPKEPDLDSFMEIWQKAAESETRFDQLRMLIMRASIFMSPLYVGKTVQLRRRCFEHVTGNDGKNNFNKRYSSFTGKNNVRFNSIKDLLFVCIRTVGETEYESQEDIDDLEKLVEAIMKNLSMPMYSEK